MEAAERGRKVRGGRGERKSTAWGNINFNEAANTEIYNHSQHAARRICKEAHPGEGKEAHRGEGNRGDSGKATQGDRGESSEASRS